MAETLYHEDKSEPQYQDYGRIQPYGFIGFLLVLGLIVGLALAVLGVPGPGLIAIEVAIWVMALCLAVVCLCLLFVLFTLRGAIRTAREQAAEVATLRARHHTHMVPLAQSAPAAPKPPPEPSPTPVIEYHAPAQVIEKQVPARAAALGSRPVDTIEGIGPTYARRLGRIGIETLRDLRAAFVNDIVRAAKVNGAMAQRWKTMADLMVLHELSADEAEVLSAAGVRSVEDLSRFQTDTLHRKAVRANNRGQTHLVPGGIQRERVHKWIVAANDYLGNLSPAVGSPPREPTFSARMAAATHSDTTPASEA